MLKCCSAIFWIYGSKNILFMFTLFKKQKNHKFSSFFYPVSRKVLTSATIIISGQKCCCHLMQDSLKYLCAQFGYDWTKNKEILREVTHRLPHPTPPSLYLTSKKQEQNHLENHSNIITHFSINGTKSLQKYTKNGQKQSKKSCAVLLYQHIIKGLTVNSAQAKLRVISSCFQNFLIYYNLRLPTY